MAECKAGKVADKVTRCLRVAGRGKYGTPKLEKADSP